MVRIPCRNPTAAEDTAKFDSAEKPPIKPVCHSEQSEESRVFQDLRPFTEPALSRTRSFAALRMTEGEGFRVTFRGHSSAESINQGNSREKFPMASKLLLTSKFKVLIIHASCNIIRCWR